MKVLVEVAAGVVPVAIRDTDFVASLKLRYSREYSGGRRVGCRALVR
jgi:hypothetical protein